VIISFWRRRNRRTNARARHVAAWAALDTCPTVPDNAGIWPKTRPNSRAGGR